MDLNVLSYLITAVGLTFFALSLVFYLLGKKSPETAKEPERIKIGTYVDLKTTQVFSIMLLTGVISVLPFVLLWFKPYHVTPKYVHDTVYVQPKDVNLELFGAAVLEDGSFAQAVNIMVVRAYQGKNDTTHYATDEQGQFLIKLPQAKPDEDFRISWLKTGYATEKRSFSFNTYPFAIRLTRGGDN